MGQRGAVGGKRSDTHIHLDLLLDAHLVGVDGPGDQSRKQTLAGDELRADGVEDALLRVRLDELRVVGGVEHVPSVVRSTPRGEHGVLLEELDERLGVDGTSSLEIGRAHV